MMTSTVERYAAALHALKSGVVISSMVTPLSPSQRRTDLVSLLSSHEALANLLISKGIISLEEYLETITEALENEVDRYSEELGMTLG